MKGKLIKKLSNNQECLEYWLYCEGLGYTLSPMAKTGVGHDIHKLTLKNCEAIEKGYDLDELVENYTKRADELSKLFGVTILGSNNSTSYRYGFQKALEILGDKKFSEEDLRKAFNCNHLSSTEKEEHWKTFPQSLQRNEWDVEIVMGHKRLNSDGFEIGFTDISSPKLDADGCLIVKRI
jgi:hypothetical protein